MCLLRVKYVHVISLAKRKIRTVVDFIASSSFVGSPNISKHKKRFVSKLLNPFQNLW